MAFEADGERRELTDLADTARRIAGARRRREDACLARVQVVNVAVSRRAAAAAAAVRAAERAAATPADASLLRWASAKAKARAKQMAEIAAAARQRGRSLGTDGGDSSDEFGYDDDEEEEEEGKGEGNDCDDGGGSGQDHAPPPGVTAEKAREAYVRAVLSRAQAMADVSEEAAGGEGVGEEKDAGDAVVSAAGSALLGLADRGKGLHEPLDHQPPARPTPVSRVD